MAHTAAVYSAGLAHTACGAAAALLSECVQLQCTCLCVGRGCQGYTPRAVEGTGVLGVNLILAAAARALCVWQHSSHLEAAEPLVPFQRLCSCCVQCSSTGPVDVYSTYWFVWAPFLRGFAQQQSSVRLPVQATFNLRSSLGLHAFAIALHKWGAGVDAVCVSIVCFGGVLAGARGGCCTSWQRLWSIAPSPSVLKNLRWGTRSGPLWWQCTCSRHRPPPNAFQLL